MSQGYPFLAQTRQHIELQGGTLSVQVAAMHQARLEQLCGFASRRNPKRSFLFVSKVLGKHIPVRPAQVLQTHKLLADGLAQYLAPGTLFIGFAETATGLGAGVFEECARRHPDRRFVYLQTTRYPLDAPLALDFQEEHSHSTGHKLYVPHGLNHADGEGLGAETVVLIDDELSTGKTAANFIRALRRVNPNLKRVALVSLLNWMSPARKREIQQQLQSLQLGFVSLLHGTFEFQPTPGYVCPDMPCADSNPTSKNDVVPLSYGRFGQFEPHLDSFEGAVALLDLDRSRPVHVLGDGEFMHPPLLLATYLERMGFDAWFQSTTRSPVLTGGAIESATTFEDHYGDGIPNYIYNLPPEESGAQVVLCHETTTALHLPAVRPMKTLSYEQLLCE